MRITEGVFSGLSPDGHARFAGGGHHSVRFRDVISIENLFAAWKKYSKGKHSHPDVAIFELRLEEHLFAMHERRVQGTWVNDPYTEEPIADPKPRIIHIASVRDRVLYQAVEQQLYQIFDKTFIHDSYASREGKGTHAGVKRFEVFARKVSANYTKPAFVLKCDIRKFFDGIDHDILYTLLAKRIENREILGLLRSIIGSFNLPPRSLPLQHPFASQTRHFPSKEGQRGERKRGLPLGNVTSQLFANIYLNELDQFVKHTLKAKYYIRYCDDFVILNENHLALEKMIEQIQSFVHKKLLLELHPHKVTIRKLRQGVDFLGYVSLSHYCVLRTRTKRRMLKRLSVLARSIRTKDDFLNAVPVIQSYVGMLSHCKSEKLRNMVKKLFQKWG